MEDIVIVAAARTAVGKFGGTLAATPATELGAIVIKSLLERSGVDPQAVGEVILGQVLAAGCGQNPARQSSLRAGLPKETPALTINAVCGSGLKAVMLAAQAVACGDSEIVIAGGQENMSLSPHVLMGSRQGQRMGDYCAACPWLGNGANVPPRAQAAHQQASHLYVQIRRRLAGKPPKDYRYRDFGSLVSLGEFSTVGNMMGGPIGGSLMVNGLFARLMYLSLYKMHELALHGPVKVTLDTMARLITRRTEPHVKLH